MESLSGSKRRFEEDEERSTDGSDNGSDLEDFIVKEDSKTPSSVEDEDDDVLPVVEVTGTVVGGRVLRDRTAMKPVERYFDTETYKRLMEQDEARDMLVLLRKWNASGEYTSTVQLTKKSSLEAIRSEYRKAKAALELPDTDDETEEEEEEEDTSDETAEEEPDEESEDESEDEESDEEDE